MSNVAAHVAQDAEPITPSSARARAIGRDCSRAQRMAPHRVRAHAVTSASFAEAVREAGATCAAVARALDCDASRVLDYANAEHEAALTLRDVRAMAEGGARAVTIALLRRELRAVEEGAVVVHFTAERHGVRIAAAVGRLEADLDEALADGVLDENERRALLRDLAAVESRLVQMRRDLEGDGGR